MLGAALGNGSLLRGFARQRVIVSDWKLKKPPRDGGGFLCSGAEAPISLCSNAALKRRASTLVPLFHLLYFQEDDGQGVEGQGLDEDQAENQGELNAGAGGRVAGQRLGGGSDGFALG